MLADKFNTSTEDVASKFSTSVSSEYSKLANNLIDAIYKKDSNQVAQLIKEGADVNFIDDRLDTPLKWALNHTNKDVLKILLHAGAQVHKEDVDRLNTKVQMHQKSEDQIALKLLEEAIKKQQQ